MRQPYPILEYDPAPHGIIEIDLVEDAMEGMPEYCVICSFREVIHQYLEQGLLTPFHTIGTEFVGYPVYLYKFRDRTLALLCQGMGATLAAYLLEETIALGGRKFIACGVAGTLDAEIAMGHLMLPTAAVRDEGASYHYLPPGREVEPTPAALGAVEHVLQQHDVDYIRTKTWTTAAIFRETPAKVALRKEEGCLAVEMETAAMFAVAHFRNVELAQILYSGDAVVPDHWDPRGWWNNRTVRELLIDLAAEACLQL